MRSAAISIADYLDSVDPRWMEAARSIAAICFEEFGRESGAMRYGMPCWSQGSDAVFAFAVQRRYLSLYGLRTAVLDAHREALAGRSVGKGCVRFTTPGSVDLELVRVLAAATAADEGPIC